MSDVTLIFSHYGYSSYLDYSLACARKTNPDARLILLGDEHNVEVAKKNGWEHRLYKAVDSSDLQSRFIKAFHHVQGVNHHHMKNGKDWLRYVFERWFFIEGLIKQESIERFWHFDSDTMVLQDLQPHSLELSGIDFSVQCNSTCLNGIISAAVVTEFCEHICNLFEDAEYISAQQREFDSINPGYAFTEMRAFDNYKSQTSRPWSYLMKYRQDKAFDDCICQEHGFQMCLLPSGERVKRFYSRQGKIYGNRDGDEIEFVSLNLSWVPDYVFHWALASLGGGCSQIEHAPCPPRYLLKGVVRKLKRLAKDALV